MNLTNLVEKIAFRRRQKELDKYANNGLAMQQEVLHYLVEYAKTLNMGVIICSVPFSRMTTLCRMFLSILTKS